MIPIPNPSSQLQHVATGKLNVATGTSETDVVTVRIWLDNPDLDA